jgi:hypothetical protein
MGELYKLVAEHKDWLMGRILGYAIQQEYSKYTSTLKEPWRLSNCGLSQPLRVVMAASTVLPLCSGLFRNGITVFHSLLETTEALIHEIEADASEIVALLSWQIGQFRFDTLQTLVERLKT